jgi:outer membrane protein OmpA-like peptidoglycan-associated protein
MYQGHFDDCLSFRIENSKGSEKNSLPRDLLVGKFSAGQIFRIENIYYDLDKSFIRADAKPELDKLVRLMKEYPINIELGSHTDSRATETYNNQLSQRRAEAATRYLVENGIKPGRVIPRGYGETMLINRCADGVNCNEEEHQKNRRTEFKILSTDSKLTDKKEINLDLFKKGDKIPMQLLGSDFFNDCLK